MAYQSLESLEEYALVRQDKAEVQVYRRTSQGWELEATPRAIASNSARSD